MRRSLSGLDKPNKYFGIFCLLSFPLTVLLLANFPSAGGNWEVAIFFIAILALATLAAYMAKDRRADDLDIPFYSIHEGGQEKEALDSKDFIVFVAVFAAIVFAAILLSQIHPILSLIAGGFLLQYLLMKTQTIIIPWIAHGLFNTLVFIMSTYSVIPGMSVYSTGIFVPTFNNLFADATETTQHSVDFISTMTMQFAAVALMEETMKVANAMGIGILTAGRIGRTGALTVATILWIIAHSILTYRI